MNDLTPVILEALDAVMSSHIGRLNAIKFVALKYQVNRTLYPSVVGERVLRGIIESQRPGICFCTAAPGGYFLPSLDADIRRREVGACVNSLNGYISGAAKRKAAILRAYPDLNQNNLFEEAGP